MRIHIHISTLLTVCISAILCGCSITKPNLAPGQIYTLKTTIDLEGDQWVLPEGATIICSSRGTVKNGKVVGQNASINNLAIESVQLSGSFREVEIHLKTDIDSLFNNASIKGCLKISGDGHSVSSTSFGILRDSDIELKNIRFDVSGTESPFLYAIGNGTNSFVIENCVFDNIPEIELLISRKMYNPTIRNCEFYGNVQKGKRIKATIALNRFYNCLGTIEFEDNSVKNCYGIAISGIGFSRNDSVMVRVRNNEIANISNGAIVFNGGEVSNVIVENNRISNIFCCGPELPGEKGIAENSAINFHGFNNLEISHNEIVDCTFSSALDIDGTSSDGRQEKGNGFICSENSFRNVLQSCFFGINDAIVSNNEFHIARQEEAQSTISAITLNSCHNIELNNNSISIEKPRDKAAYPILVRQNSNRTSGKLSIHNNDIISDGVVYLMIYDGFTGEIEVFDNNASSSTSSKPLKWANNSKTSTARIFDDNMYR